MTVGEKLERALDMSDLTLAELAEAIGVGTYQLRKLMEPRVKAVSVPLQYWYLMSKALSVPIEYWLPDDIDGDLTQTLLTVKAIRAQHEEQSDTLRNWEKHIDQERRKKWRNGK